MNKFMKQAHFIMSLAALLAVTAIVITALVTTNKTNNQDRFSSNGSGTV